MEELGVDGIGKLNADYCLDDREAVQVFVDLLVILVKVKIKLLLE